MFAIIVKSVNRIFYRSAVNQGLPLIVHREAVEAYKPDDTVEVNLGKGEIRVGEARFRFEPLPDKLKQILESGGLVNYIKNLC